MAENRPLASIEAVDSGLAEAGYIASRQISTAVFLAQRLDKPILVEGPAGVGKTELAKSIAAWQNIKLIRMQCYEGLDESKALYEWKYAKQLLYTQILKDKLGEVIGQTETLPAALNKLHDFGDIFFSKQFVEPRPLLQALEQKDGCVLLIDEIDKADAEFEAFLLEILSDYQITIPEIGRISRGDQADRHPDLERQPRSRRRAEAPLHPSAYRLPRAAAGSAHHRDAACRAFRTELRKKIVAFVHELRTLDLKKLPSVSETIDWARVLLLLHTSSLSTEVVRDTLNVLLKYEVDMETTRPRRSPS